ncbi:hypothetical protein ACE193_23835 [Bernardetia sp. OM2101]|uniref:hypothetical protein n=1 Tax=Bernardetia sp. OM2101 TaxID=3344876 RepID=UPI0035D0EEF0
MKSLEEDFTGNDKDIVASFERKKTIILRKLESVEDKKVLINSLLKLAKPLSNQSKWYIIATDIFTIYEKKILNQKDVSSSQFHPMAKQNVSQNEISNYKSSFSAEEQQLINIFFRACMEAKREKVAKELVQLSEENGFLIEDEKDYKTKFIKKKKKMTKQDIKYYIFALVIAISVIFVLYLLDLNEEVRDKWINYSLLGLAFIELGLAFYLRYKAQFFD